MDIKTGFLIRNDTIFQTEIYTIKKPPCYRRWISSLCRQTSVQQWGLLLLFTIKALSNTTFSIKQLNENNATLLCIPGQFIIISQKSLWFCIYLWKTDCGHCGRGVFKQLTFDWCSDDTSQIYCLESTLNCIVCLLSIKSKVRPWCSCQ